MKYYVFILIIFISSCKYGNFENELSVTEFPNEIALITKNKCATAGCHTQNDKTAASGLSLETWSDLFKGANSGASVVGGFPNKSPFFTFVNIHQDLGVSNSPTMPVNNPVLSKQEIETIRNWISVGAPNRNGEKFFKDSPGREKAYITNQGCDIVAVMDLKFKVVSNYVEVGVLSGITESPHQVKVSPDNKKWVVTFINGSVLQVYNTTDDKLLANIEIGLGNWNTVTISSDSKKAFVVDWSAEGKVAYIDLEQLSLVKLYQGPGFLNYPHGSYVTKDGKWLYLTAQTGNFIYKLDISDPLFPSVDQIVLGNGETPSLTSKYDAHEIFFTPDEQYYYVTCQSSNEVRVLETQSDQLIKVIPVGEYPLEMTLDPKKNRLYVSCMEDDINLNNAALKRKGVISIIDIGTNNLVKHLYSGFQPHGLAYDESTNSIWVTNRNISPGGPAPHHTTDCAGKNGNVVFINCETMELIPKSHELSVDPYTVAIKKN
jgi:YVTN family beta-propeller protein